MGILPPVMEDYKQTLVGVGCDSHTLIKKLGNEIQVSRTSIRVWICLNNQDYCQESVKRGVSRKITGAALTQAGVARLGQEGKGSGAGIAEREPAPCPWRSRLQTQRCRACLLRLPAGMLLLGALAHTS